MEIKIQVLYFASIKEILGKKSDNINLIIKEGSLYIVLNEVKNLITSNIKEESNKLNLFDNIFSRCLFAINDEYVDVINNKIDISPYIKCENIILSIIPPISGG